MAELAETVNQATKTNKGREGKYLTFSLDEEQYGIGILKIKEIIGMMPITLPRWIRWSSRPLPMQRSLL
jgi:purine-binding chemotaxis protein CheW